MSGEPAAYYTENEG